MVAIGPRGTAYTAVAFEIFADLYYRSSASAGAAANHPAIRALLDETVAAQERAEIAGRLAVALRYGLAPVSAVARPSAAFVSGQGNPHEEHAEEADDTGPAAFAVSAIWARLTSGSDDAGVLGAGFLAADFTRQLLFKIGVPRQGRAPGHVALATLAFECRVDLTALATRAEQLATTLRHLVLERLSSEPDSAGVIFTGFDRLAVVYPQPMLDDALRYATESREVA